MALLASSAPSHNCHFVPTLPLLCHRNYHLLPMSSLLISQRWNPIPRSTLSVFESDLWLAKRYLSRCISCQAGRRHYRKRDFVSGSGKSRNIFSREDSVVVEERRGNVDREKVVIMIDLEDMKNKAAGVTEAAKNVIQKSAVRAVRMGEAVVEDSKEFWRDLRSSIAVQKDRRIVISVRRSSIEYAANALLWSLLLVAVWKIFVKAAKTYRWGWEESFDSQGLVRRDRSLGGKEVMVSKKDGTFLAKIPTRKVATRAASPLDGVEITRSEKELAKLRGAQAQSVGRSAARLPGWWPASEPPTAMPNLGEDYAQTEAFALMRVIMEKRLSGRDFDEDDILQLRRLCKYSGARVRFDTVNVRDSFYRAAIDLVLSCCGRITTGSTSAEVGGEKATHFLAGLADNIELEADRAATMVNAAVAARTRSTFLQTWALCVQGKILEAEEDILRLVRIHTIFPSDNNSPEMEMVAQGLGRHLSLDERKHLLQMYLKVGGNSTHRVASEALGLVSTRERA